MAIQTIVTRIGIPATLVEPCRTALRSIAVVALLAVVAAGIVVGVTLATRQTPRQPKALPEQAADRQEPADARRGADPRGVQGAGRRAASRRWRQLGREYPKRSGRAALSRARAALGRLRRATPQPRCAKAKKRRPRHAHGRCRPTASCTPSYQVGYPIFHPLEAEPAARAGLAPAGRGASALRASGSSRAPRAPQPNDDEAQVAAAVAPVRQGQPEPRVLASRPAHAAVPEEPERPLLPRIAARVDGSDGPGGRPVREGRRARPEDAIWAGTPRSSSKRDRAWDQPIDQMSRSAHGGPSDADATFPGALGRRALNRGGRRWVRTRGRLSS